MPLPTATPPEWTADNAKNLRDFLETDTGRCTLEWLAFLAPVLLDGTDVNRTLVANGEVKGYTAAVSTLVGLTREQPNQPNQKEHEPYPSLDDDAKWDKETDTRK